MQKRNNLFHFHFARLFNIFFPSLFKREKKRCEKETILITKLALMFGCKTFPHFQSFLKFYIFFCSNFKMSYNRGFQTRDPIDVIAAHSLNSVTQFKSGIQHLIPINMGERVLFSPAKFFSSNYSSFIDSSLKPTSWKNRAN